MQDHENNPIQMYKQQQEKLQSMLDSIDYDEDQIDEFFYGYHDGKFGWHKIAYDYPGFCVHFIGYTYKEAEEYVQEILDEYADDLAADREEDDDWTGG